MKKIEIEKKKKLPKNKFKSLNMIDIDFSSIKLLVGNKTLLEHSFFIIKKECLNN